MLGTAPALLRLRWLHLTLPAALPSLTLIRPAALSGRILLRLSVMAPAALVLPAPLIPPVAPASKTLPLITPLLAPPLTLTLPALILIGRLLR